MRVNIKLSVELEDVPLKISTMLAENYDSLKGAAQMIADSSNNLIIEGSVRESLDCLKKSQKEIYEVYNNLNDMAQILIGYENILLETEYGDASQLELALPLDEGEEADA